MLSGGGAKGVAHIGVLQVLEEAGIPIDYIVGSSMGAIVGGLYAIGYDARTLDSLVRSQDWDFLLSDRIYRPDLPLVEREKEARYSLSLPFDRLTSHRRPIGFVSGQNIYNLFTDLTIGYHDSTDFSRFSIPFACISADLLNKKEIIMDHGELALAMRASMAIPGFFTPVRWRGTVLVDGGVLNNFPTDIARKMGADIVIGVDVQADLMEKEKLEQVSTVLPQMINLLCMNKYNENLALADILIRPDITGFSSLSFSKHAIDTLLLRGETAALNKWDELIGLRTTLGIPEDKPTYRREVGRKPIGRFHVRHIYIKGVSPQMEQWILRRVRLKAGREVTHEELHRTINALYGTNSFSAVNYNLSGGAEGYDLTLVFTPHPMNYLHMGFRFDSEEMAAILVNTTFSNRLIRGTQVSFTGRLSKHPYLRTDLTLESTFLRQFNLSGEFRFNDISLYQKGEKTNNVTYRYYLGELGSSNLYFRNFMFQTGIRYEFFDYNSFLHTGDRTADVRPEGFISYYGSARFETFDRGFYPERGFLLKADYSHYTDNFITYKGGAPFSALALHLRGVVPITNRLKLLPAYYSRFLIGNNPAYPYYNYVGGVEAGRQVAHQLPFWGISRIEIFDPAVAIGQLQLRQRMGSHHYLFAVGNVAMHDPNAGDIFGNRPIWGGGAGYSHYSKVGPVDLILSYANWSKKTTLYFNLGFYF